jgi:hypothetical protein
VQSLEHELDGRGLDRGVRAVRDAGHGRGEAGYVLEQRFVVGCA